MSRVGFGFSDVLCSVQYPQSASPYVVYCAVHFASAGQYLPTKRRSGAPRCSKSGAEPGTGGPATEQSSYTHKTQGSEHDPRLPRAAQNKLTQPGEVETTHSTKPPTTTNHHHHKQKPSPKRGKGGAGPNLLFRGEVSFRKTRILSRQVPKVLPSLWPLLPNKVPARERKSAVQNGQAPAGRGGADFPLTPPPPPPLSDLDKRIGDLDQLRKRH